MDQGSWNPNVSWNVNNQDIDKLLDPRTANRVMQNLQRDFPNGIPRSKPVATQNKNKAYAGKNQGIRRSSPGNRTNQDQDLLASMAARLQNSERQLLQAKQELQGKSLEIIRLQEENRVLKITASKDFQSQYEELQVDNQKLRQQVQEMESYLSQYGLKWVGNQKQGQFDSDQALQDINGSDPLYKYNLPSEINIADLHRKIQSLNQQIDTSQMSIQHSNGGARLQETEVLPIFFYKNGLVIKGYPFYTYHSNDGQSIMCDILDSYFPYILRRRYPNGIPLQMIDQSDDILKSDKAKVRDIHQPSNGLLSAQEFLDQIPKTKIKEGNIIPVREEAAKIFGQHQIETVEIRTQVDLVQNPEPNLYTTLRIKTETGRKNLIIKMWNQDSFSSLIPYITRYREKSGEFEIKSIFPAKNFSVDETRSFQELDLCPNFALVIRLL